MLRRLRPHAPSAPLVRLALLLSLALPAAHKLRAADAAFLRGDSNQDGVVSIADSHFILSSLFRNGTVPACQKSADVNDDGQITLTDAVRLLTYLFLSGGPPCDPFPSTGLDSTLDNLVCDAYGGGAPLEDATARLRLTDATAGADGKATVSVLISASRPVGGFSGVFSVEGGALAGGLEVEHVMLTGADEGGYRAARVVGGLLTFSSLNSFIESRPTAPGSETRVMDLTLCLAKGTRAGQYLIQPQAGELVDQETGLAINPGLSESTLLVSGDLGPGAGCESETDPTPPASCQAPGVPPPVPDPANGVPFVRGDANADGRISVSDAVMIRRYLFNGKKEPACLDAADVDDNGIVQLPDVVRILGHLFFGDLPPEPPGTALGGDPTEDYLSCQAYEATAASSSDDLIRIGSIEAAPGEEVAVPVHLTNAVAVEAFQLVVRYDPSVFTPRTNRGLEFGGTYYENGTEGPYRAVAADPGDGLLTVGFIPSLIETSYDTPPGEDRPVFKVLGTIAASATPGSTIELIPTNGPDDQGAGPHLLRNELTHEGEARYASTLPRLERGLIGIVGDQTFFIRGDANGDEKLDISDPIRTLGALFLGGEAIACEDAADANDDGKLDLSDPIATLERLFLGANSLPPPSTLGPDPTPDALRCRRAR